MSIVVTSTPNTEVSAEVKTTTVETPAPEVETKSAPASESKEGETLEASDASEETSEELEAKDGDGDADDAEVTEDRPKKKVGGFQKRIQKLTKRVSDAEREREYWREQALKTQSKEPAKAKTQGSVSETGDTEPNEEDFETHKAYVAALTDWKVEQKLKERDVAQRTEQIRTAHQTRVQTLQAKVKDFAKKHDDFQELIDQVDTPMSPAVEEFFLMAADNAPELMYELAKNPDEYERINNLGPLAAARELGKIEARLASPQKEKPKVTTKAPPPPNPVSGRSDKAGKRTIFDPDLSQAEYEQMRREQIAKRSAAWG